jgi:hypothetical protein
VRAFASTCYTATASKVRRGAIGAVLLIVSLAALLASAPAQAATTYRQVGAFAEGAAEIGPVAVDDSTGDVFLINGGRVQVFAPQGTSATPIAEFAGGYPASVAVDQTTDDVYVSEPGAGKITRYVSDGADPPTYTPDPTFISPLPGSDPSDPNSAEEIGSFASPIAVDPTNGDLLIADSGKHRISRFTSSGAFVGNFDGTGSLGGPFHNILSFAVDSAGRIYVADNTEGELTFEGKSVLERFAADGTPDNSFDPQINQPALVGYDGKAGNIIVVGHLSGYYYDQEPSHITVIHNDEIIAALDFPPESLGSHFTGISVDGSSGRLYIAMSSYYGIYGTTQVGVYEPVIFPDLVLDQPTDVTTTTAHVTGSINPLGAEAHYRIEDSFDGGSTWSATEAQVATGTSPVPISIDLTELAGNSTYQLRIRAVTPAGTFYSPLREIETPGSGPGVITGRAGERTTSGATVYALVNPYGLQSTYHFEYGLTAAYGSRLPAAYDDAIGAGRTNDPVFKVITGLQPETTYHYRVVATNSFATTYGEDRTFTTASAAAPVRLYEQVSPAEKDGTNIEGGRGIQASPDGNQIFYGAKSPIGGDEYETEGGPLFSVSSAQRSEAGWRSVGIDPPVLESPIAVKFLGTLANSEDGKTSFVTSLKKLAPGAGEGDTNLYLRDTATGAYTTVLSVAGPYFYMSYVPLILGSSPFIAGTPNFSHIVFEAKNYAELIPGTPGGAVLEWTGGEVRVASVTPGGTEVNGRGFAISTDGSKIVFESEGALYDRIDGARTIPIPGAYTGSTANGRYVFTTGEELTSDSAPGMKSLYRFDTVSEETELLTAMGATSEVVNSKANELPVYQISPDGTTIFFTSTSSLANGGVAGRPNIYVWHEGTVRHIAALDPNREGIELTGRTSPDGNYFAFLSYSKLTGYNPVTTACAHLGDVEGQNPEACHEVYRYAVDSGELVCASCRPDGGSPTGQADFRPVEGKVDFGNPHFPREMLDNGEVLFDTTDALSPLDTNGARDVYSFDGEEQHLISSGKGAGGSIFADATADGRNVFFVTADRLVGQDTDALADLYDARIGGGIASQNPPPPRGECIRDDCKATPNAGPELPFGGSEALSGPGNVAAPAKKGCGKDRHSVKSHGKTRCVKNQRKSAKPKRGQKNHTKAKRDRRQGR